MTIIKRSDLIKIINIVCNPDESLCKQNSLKGIIEALKKEGIQVENANK